MQISPLGVLLIGREAQASGGLPTPVVSVKFKDGTIEEMMSELSFDTDIAFCLAALANSE